jgi:hypothetical protein
MIITDLPPYDTSIPIFTEIFNAVIIIIDHPTLY